MNVSRGVRVDWQSRSRVHLYSTSVVYNSTGVVYLSRKWTFAKQNSFCNLLSINRCEIGYEFWIRLVIVPTHPTNKMLFVLTHPPNLMCCPTQPNVLRITNQYCLFCGDRIFVLDSVSDLGHPPNQPTNKMLFVLTHPPNLICSDKMLILPDFLGNPDFQNSEFSFLGRLRATKRKSISPICLPKYQLSTEYLSFHHISQECISDMSEHVRDHPHTILVGFRARNPTNPKWSIFTFWPAKECFEVTWPQNASSTREKSPPRMFVCVVCVLCVCVACACMSVCVGGSVLRESVFVCVPRVCVVHEWSVCVRVCLCVYVVSVCYVWPTNVDQTTKCWLGGRAFLPFGDVTTIIGDVMTIIGDVISFANPVCFGTRQVTGCVCRWQVTYWNGKHVSIL